MNIIAPFLSIAFGLYWIFMGITRYRMWVYHGPGGGVFPVVAGIITVVFGSIILVRIIRKIKETKEKMPLNMQAVKITVVSLISLLFIYLIGMTITMTVFLFCWLRFFDKRPVVKSIIICIGTIVILYGIFRVFLRVPLPVGLLGIL